MNLGACAGQLRGAQFHVLVLCNRQVVVHADFGLAVGVGGAVFFGFQLGVGVLFYRVVAFVANADFLVIFDVLVPVPLGMDENLFGAFFIFDAQFVVAATARGTEGLEYSAGLVGRQRVRNLVFLVVQAAGHQRLVRVALKE
ncbi:hypothetical protein ALQ27_200111 [Pseudomonas syringae pv. delphinii]|nr:hypothetical protein ALQ27_200111 [Pseudomonas syringae pv. delphinii]